MKAATDTHKALQRDVLVVLHCYRSSAARSRAVLDAIPDRLLRTDGWHFLGLADNLTRPHAAVFQEWSRENPGARVTTLVSHLDLGHGGIQKLAYRFALDRGYDFVVVFPVDGQYDPEDIERLVRICRRDGVDALIGSRLPARRITGRPMPWHIRLASRLLSAVQNRVLGIRLAEYHSAMRVYSCKLLARIPFELNTNAYHFDIEVILQAIYSGASVDATPIGLDYDVDLHRSSRARYAVVAAITTISFRLHTMGVFCSLRYRNLSPLLYRDKSEQHYSSHATVLRMVTAMGPRNVLDLGCGPGFVAAECQAVGCAVLGIDRHPPAVPSLPHILADIEDVPLPVDPFAHDVVLLLDVIEHLREPERFLIGMRNQSRSIRTEPAPPTLIVSTPNVAFVLVRLNLLLGRFTYAERGILDIDHKRLFTRASLLRALQDCGYDLMDFHCVPPPIEAVIPGRLGRLLAGTWALAARLWPGMLAFQFVVVCSPRPGLEQALRDATTATAET